MNKTYIGIDPGLTGGIAILEPNNNLFVFRIPTIETSKKEIDAHAVAALFRDYDDHYKGILCAIEHAQAMPKQGVTSMFSYGKGFGVYLGIFSALSMPYRLVKPQTWKRALGCTSDKQATVQIANQIFPKFCHEWRKKTYHGLAEAALIAYFAKKTFM